MNPLIVVIGAPAAGKTTVAKDLAKRLKAIHLQEDHFNSAQRWRKFKDEETNQHSLELLESLIKVEQPQFPVVIEGLFARSSSKDKLLRWKSTYGAKLIYLRVETDTALKRNALAARGKLVKETNIRELVSTLDKLYNDSEKISCIDNNQPHQTAVVKQILNHLDQD